MVPDIRYSKGVPLPEADLRFIVIIMQVWRL
jgi:hypothetical protein